MILYCCLGGLVTFYYIKNSNYIDVSVMYILLRQYISEFSKERFSQVSRHNSDSDCKQFRNLLTFATIINRHFNIRISDNFDHYCFISDLMKKENSMFLVQTGDRC